MEADRYEVKKNPLRLLIALGQEISSYMENQFIPTRNTSLVIKQRMIRTPIDICYRNGDRMTCSFVIYTKQLDLYPIPRAAICRVQNMC
jgi:hypothetical protein